MKSGNDTTTGRGQQAEDAAARLLARHGLVVLARNYRCRGGELDLVCRDAGTLVFVEVRLRRHGGFGGAAASITPAKQRRIVLAAQHYLASNGLAARPPACRFDCILFDGEAAVPEWIRNAFVST